MPTAERGPAANLVAFAADVITTGTVLGADCSCTPAQVAEILGTDFAENREKDTLWCDWGLVEFSWHRGSGTGPWRGEHFSVQFHRLRRAEHHVEAAIGHRYGQLEGGLRLAELLTALLERGVELAEIPAAGPVVVEYWQADTQTVVLVDEPGDGGLVWQIYAPLPAEAVAARHNRHQKAPLTQSIRYLAAASADERTRWLDRRDPDTADRTNWWLHLLLLIDQSIDRQQEQGLRKEWVLLYLWVLRQAGGRAALPAGEIATRTSYFAHLQRERYRQDDAMLVLLPSADEVVRGCLDAAPMTFEEATVPVELRSDSLEAMRRSRATKNLINAAVPHRDHLRHPQLAAELARWADLLPSLV